MFRFGDSIFKRPVTWHHVTSVHFPSGGLRLTPGLRQECVCLFALVVCLHMCEGISGCMLNKVYLLPSRSSQSSKGEKHGNKKSQHNVTIVVYILLCCGSREERLINSAQGWNCLGQSHKHSTASELYLPLPTSKLFILFSSPPFLSGSLRRCLQHLERIGQVGWHTKIHRAHWDPT